MDSFPLQRDCIPDSKARDSGFHKQKVSGFPYIGRTEWIKKIQSTEYTVYRQGCLLIVGSA